MGYPSPPIRSRKKARPITDTEQHLEIGYLSPPIRSGKKAFAMGSSDASLQFSYMCLDLMVYFNPGD